VFVGGGQLREGVEFVRNALCSFDDGVSSLRGGCGKRPKLYGAGAGVSGIRGLVWRDLLRCELVALSALFPR